MSKRSHIPTFNMKVVVQETGLKPDTLRAWERRYGMPSPKRTKGGHRLYSQYEIDKLKWLVTRQEDGMSISKAVDLWSQLEAEGRDPLEALPDLPAMPVKPAREPITGDMLVKLRADWVEACLQFNEDQAQHTLAQAFALFPIETVCFELLQRGLNEIGQGWFEGRVSVQQEHFASELSLRQLEALLASVPAARGNGQLLVACPPKEHHTFSPLLLTLLLRQRNWDVVYLGANVPVERLEVAVRTVKPQLVILIAQTLYTAGTMLAMANLLHTEKIPLAFGGGVFNYIEETRTRMPGYYLGTELKTAPEVIKNIVQARPLLHEEFKVPSQAYQKAVAHFRKKRAAIEAHVYEAVPLEDLSAIELRNANEDLGNNLTAALTLGSMSVLDANIEWVQGLLVNYHYRMPAEMMKAYIQAYFEGVKLHLDGRGKPIRDWFEELTRSGT